MDIRKLALSLMIFSAPLWAEGPSAPHITPAIEDSVSHPTDHFTQGLFFDGKDLIESTGLYGKSGLYRRTLEGDVTDSIKLNAKFFGEGTTLVGEDIFMVTWKEKKGFVFQRKPFKLKAEFSIPTEGWGIAFWRDVLLMSNGSSKIMQFSPKDMSFRKSTEIKDGKFSISMLNELEVVGNTLYANIWQTNLIAVIEMPSGKVEKYLDFTDKVNELRKKNPDMDVLNGIAYDGKNLWITGKNWPQIYKLKEIQ
ncbi:MAG: glutaminyl-peptide cyclotransferase [Fibrobacter sp.]|nr:glutaminyl-peptide cyclotransferase [Fibrobacter sp.]